MPGFLLLLTLMLIGFKLAGIVAFSWLWVLAPIWGPVIALSLVGMILIGIATLLAIGDKKSEKKV